MQFKPSKNHSNRRNYNWLAYELFDRFIEKYKIYYNGIVVDLGCGEAPYKEFICQYCNKYIGVDWSKSLHNSKADVISDLNKEINLQSEFADVVISFSVMEHLYNPQVFLNEAYRIIKHNGKLIIQIPWQWWIHEEPYDYYRYSPYILKKMLETSGFQNINIEPMCGFFSMITLKTNYFMCRVIGLKIIKKLRLTKFLNILFIPIWAVNQRIAPLLDKLDKNWELETAGFFVTAIKM